MNEAGFPQAKICISNGLKGSILESLRNQGADFQTIGAGDNISKPEGNVGCVYKEVATLKDGKWNPRIKLSEDEIKIINPDYKKLYRAYSKESGYAIGDIMANKDEVIEGDELVVYDPTDARKRRVISNFKLEELQKDIILNGVLVYKEPPMKDKIVYCDREMSKLYPEVRRELNPDIYKVSGTEKYVQDKEALKEKIKTRIPGRR